MNSVKKVFIIGSSRSGTTMMSRILGKQPDIFTFNELHFFEQVITPNEFNKTLDEKAATKAFNRLLNIQKNGLFKFLENKELQYEETKEVIEELSNLTPKTIFDEFLTYEVKSKGKSYACEQTPTNIFYIETLLEAYPDAKFLHMVRDSRGVLLSQKKRWKRKFNGSTGTPLRQSMRNYANYHPLINGLLWKSSVSKGLIHDDKDNFLTVRFEDFLTEPEFVLKGICTFLEVEYDAKMLLVTQVGSSNAADDKTKLGIRKEVKEKWKSGGLLKGEIYLNQLMAKDGLQKAGYDLMSFRMMPLSTLWVLFLFPIKLGLASFLNIGRVKNIRQVISKRLK